MATAGQIQYRIGQAKKKLAKLSKEILTTKAKMKKLEMGLKKAKKVAPKSRPRRKVAKKAAARKKK
jgi:cell division protein FtsB